MQRPRHPLHPPLVHFPIALLGTSPAFDLVGLVRDEALWWTIAFWNITLGLAIAVLTATTGLLDSLRVPADSPASAVVTRHMLAVLAALSCYGCALVVRGGPGTPVGTTLWTVLALESIGLGLLMLGGFLGGELVYRHGAGSIAHDESKRASKPERPGSAH